ncbi:MAG: chromosome segregation protein SMC [Ignavibacteriae bacterium]|nr:chromosome segregation protein SMC [Ignavibacteriota bacterium]
MYLSKLEIFGFKSFPEKTTIEFDSGVAAIVGPNGSGKSNIVDAIRWVLGEQGDKALRSEKREDVVFNGTSKRKPLSIAEVSLTIQNNKNILPTEYSEVQIARRFFRSGETEYYLNGTKVRLKDIKNLFVDTGIGPDAYSVIELKMVDAILSSVKNERRKLFEEAAGIVSYKYNRDLTIKRLESVKESLNRVNDIIREKQRNVNAMERQVKRVEEAKIVFEELKNLEIVVANFEFKMMADEIQEIKDHESENINLKESLLKEISEYDEKYDTMREENQKYEDTLNGINEEISEKKEEINELERFNLVTSEKVKNYEQNIQRLNSENDSFEESISRNTDKSGEIKQKIAVLNNTLDLSETSLYEKKTNVDSTIKIINEKKDEIISIGQKVKELTKTLNTKKSEYEKNKIKLDNNLERLNTIGNNIEADLKTIESYEKEKNELDLNLNSLLNEFRKIENEYNTSLETKAKLEENISDSEKILTQKNLELQNKTNRIVHLQNLLDSFEDYAEGVKFLMKDKKHEGIKTVLDAVDVNDKFKTAIETALGEVSNYLILDDSRNLNKLIGELNANEKGKVTFILNDKLAYSNPFVEFDYYRPDFLDMEGVFGFATDLIKCKSPEYRLLLNYLLDEYVIVSDVDIAFRLSKDNYYKFITTEGDIITESVIRAGSRVKEESIKLGREKQIERLIKEKNSFEQEIEEHEKKLTEQKLSLENLDVDEQKEKLDTLERNITSCKNDVSILVFKIEELNKTYILNQEIYKRIQEENKTLNEIINYLIEELSKLENQESNLEKELAFLTEEFNVIDQNYKQFLNEYNSFNLEVIKLKNELKNEEASLQRATNTIEYQKKQIETNKRQILDESGLLEEFRINIENNNGKLSSLRSQEQRMTDDYNLQKKLFDERKDIQNRVDDERRGKRLLFDKVSQKLIDSQIKIKENDIKSENIRTFLKKKYELDIFENFGEVNENENLSKSLNDFTNVTGEFDLEKAKSEIDELTVRLNKLGGGYQQLVWDDFQSEKEELERMISQKNDLLESEKDIRKTIEKINNEARERFLKTFEEIRNNFIRIFTELFQEGDEANLKLIYEADEEGVIIEDPLEAKIEITAKPRGKRPTSIELLSGGEKTLTAIALLFAIYLVKPSPFCILDEVDAPLDVANLGRFNKMIRKFSENTQFILITHNERTMERVDRLYGVTMQEPGVTTIVETKFRNN